MLAKGYMVCGGDRPVRHMWMHFPNANIKASIQIALQFIPKVAIHIESPLCQVMDRSRTGDKLSPEPMLTKIYGASWLYQVPEGSNGIISIGSTLRTDYSICKRAQINLHGVRNLTCTLYRMIYTNERPRETQVTWWTVFTINIV